MTKSTRFRRIMAGLMIACALLMGGCAANNPAQTPVPTAQATDAPKILEKDTRSAQYFDTAVVITLYNAPEGLMDELMAACDKLQADLAARPAGGTAAMRYSRDVLVPDMAEARRIADRLEVITAAKYWPFPTYSEMLYYL